MVHFKQFETDEELSEWQSENPEKVILNMMPILLETTIASMPDFTDMSKQSARYGIMATWRNTATNGVGSHLKCISLLRGIVGAWEKSDDMVAPMREIKEALLRHREGNNLRQDGEEQAQA